MPGAQRLRAKPSSFFSSLTRDDSFLVKDLSERQKLFNSCGEPGGGPIREILAGLRRDFDVPQTESGRRKEQREIGSPNFLRDLLSGPVPKKTQPTFKGRKVHQASPFPSSKGGFLKGDLNVTKSSSKIRALVKFGE